MLRDLLNWTLEHLRAAEDSPKLPILPPLLPLAALLLAIAGEWLAPLDFLPDTGGSGWLFWTGLACIGLGLWLGLGGVRAFWKNGTNVEPTKPALTLVVSGPYRFTRNPMYWGFLLLQLGLSLIFDLEWGIVLLPMLWLALDRIIVAREERYLLARFGAPYADYLGHSRRWL